MDHREHKNRIPCVIDAGVLTNFRDMQRILRDLGHVRYVELCDGQPVRQGEGYVMSVMANDHSATIVAHKRLYLNVHGFDFLRLEPIDGNTAFDLVDDARTLRLLPQTDPLDQDLAPDEASETARLLDETLGGNYAEIFADEDESGEP